MPLRIKRRKGSPNLWLRGTVRGIPVYESCKTDDAEVAEEIRIRREAQLLQNSIYGTGAAGTWLEAVALYLEGGGERRYLQPLIDRFGTTPLARIDQAAIDRAAREMKPAASSATRNRQVYMPISAVLHYAAKRGLCEYRKIERLKQPRGRIRWLRPDEAERLIHDCAPHLRPLVIFLFGTGARLSEAVYLDWSNVDLAARRVRFMETKNGEPRGVPLNERVLIELANLSHRDGAVFRRPAPKPRRGERPRLGEPYARRDDGGGQIKTAFRGACRRAGITDFTPHDCRHTWASWFYAETRDIRALMDLGGWKSLAMVERYTHLNPDHLAAAIERLPWAKAVQGQSESA